MISAEARLQSSMIEREQTNDKTLSVVVPNYNDSAHLRFQLAAICEQSFKPLEVLVIDDGSTDNSIEIIEEFVAKYPFVRLLKNEVNRGVVYTINRGAAEARGDYLYSASANDLVLPGFFEKSMRLLSQYPQAGLCCTDSRLINVVDDYVEDVHTYWAEQPCYLSPKMIAAATRRLKRIRQPISNTVILRRDLLPAGNMYIPEVLCYGDYMLHLDIIFRYGCCFVPEPLEAVRWTGDSFSHRINNDPKTYRHVFMEIISRLASPEWEEVTKWAIDGRIFRDFTPSVRTPANAWTAIKRVKNPNKYAQGLFWHFVVETLLERANFSIGKLRGSYRKAALGKPVVLAKQAAGGIAGLLGFKIMRKRTFERLYEEHKSMQYHLAKFETSSKRDDKVDGQ